MSDTSLYKKMVKQKRLQRLGKSLVVIIPHVFLRTLDWTQETKLVLEMRPFRREIVISENTVQI